MPTQPTSPTPFSPHTNPRPPSNSSISTLHHPTNLTPNPARASFTFFTPSQPSSLPSTNSKSRYTFLPFLEDSVQYSCLFFVSCWNSYISIFFPGGGVRR
ncbi:hypothetical protein L873DRAFT_512880 [Choiromyces venosus 120613-1]|uniref:Uncharacterized protein n=1 Tax=Choiromyces venosus 120613-1 TaxID=1336337 RepID=A0A3N4IUT6_9PEZI|nr:hypothetical protein L873DRAFT_512880 [Choiromyces venosus 120613-1]